LSQFVCNCYRENKKPKLVCASLPSFSKHCPMGENSLNMITLFAPLNPPPQKIEYILFPTIPTYLIRIHFTIFQSKTKSFRINYLTAGWHFW
jgi:translation initiation factor 2B subunit (eIF-2B alpha/beta/delta family)